MKPNFYKPNRNVILRHAAASHGKCTEKEKDPPTRLERAVDILFSVPPSERHDIFKKIKEHLI